MSVRRVIPLAATMALVVLGCGRTTELTDVWADSLWDGEPIDNVLVIGVSPDPDIRTAFENYFVEQFKKEKVQAFSAAAALGVGRIDSTAIARYVKDQQIDAILVTRLLGSDVDRTYVQGTGYMGPTYYGGFYGYYNYGYTEMSTPGYLAESTVIRLETNIYLKDSRLLWSAISDTFNPGSEKEIIKGLAQAVLDDLYKRRML
jgi:hypothetical protein